MYKILEIVLIKSNFERKLFKLVENVKISTEQSIELKGDNDLGDNNLFTVQVNVSIKQFINETKDEVFNANISFLGSFEMIIKEETPKLSHENFIKVNAPAIIYPYIREHLSSLTGKAGFLNYFLQPFNFVEENKKNNI